MTERIQVKLILLAADVPELVSELQNDPAVTVLSTRTQSDATSQDFGLTDAASVATIMSLAFYLVDLGARIHATIQKKNRTITIQTPSARIDFRSEDELTKEQIDAKLRAAVEMHQ